MMGNLGHGRIERRRQDVVWEVALKPDQARPELNVRGSFKKLTRTLGPIWRRKISRYAVDRCTAATTILGPTPGRERKTTKKYRYLDGGILSREIRAATSSSILKMT